MQSQITFYPPRTFTRGWKLRWNLIGLLPTILILAVFAGGVILVLLHRGMFIPVMALVAVIDLAVYGAFIFFSPLFNGNSQVARYFSAAGQGFLVQVSFTPRRYPGLEGILDDADDFGLLAGESDWIVFRGAASYLALHKSDLAEAHFENIGLRAAFVSGDALHLRLRSPLAGVSKVVVCPRYGLTLPAARNMNKSFRACMEQWLLQAYGPARVCDKFGG
jgi:hypothetical protein